MMQKTLFENENLIKPLKTAFCIGAVSCCFLSLIISDLESKLKISLKKFADSK